MSGLVVLVVEDRPEWALLVEEMLRRELGGEATAIIHGSLAEARGTLLEGGFDCVLLDLMLPDSAGLETLRAVSSRAPQAPVVVLSSEASEAVALRAVDEGAQDYLMKATADGPRIAGAIRRAMERKRVEVAAALRMTHDALTGLPNRTLFLDRLELALGRLERRSRSAAVMFVDLDGEAGDRILLAAADRLRALMRPGDTVARFGGDEFMLLCDDVASAEDAIAVAQRLRAGLSDPYVIDGERVTLGASIGVVLAADRARPAEALVRDAERGMREAKLRGGGVELYVPRPLRVADAVPVA